jgi:hypothetical protein
MACQLKKPINSFKYSLFLLLSIYLIISAIFIINYGDRLETIEKLQYPIEKEEKKIKEYKTIH